MTRGPIHLHACAALAAGLALAGAPSAFAQPQSPTDAHPWRDPGQAALRPHVTSSLDATDPPAAEEHQSRALAAAVFSRPSAAQRAADKATEASASAIAPADPKPEWLNDKGREAHAGGAGVELSRPF